LIIKCYSNTYANDRLIRLNKFVSRFTDGFCNLFFYQCLNTPYNILVRHTCDTPKLTKQGWFWWTHCTSELDVWNGTTTTSHLIPRIGPNSKPRFIEITMTGGSTTKFRRIFRKINLLQNRKINPCLGKTYWYEFPVSYSLRLKISVVFVFRKTTLKNIY
jgi:hypothetical protein